MQLRSGCYLLVAHRLAGFCSQAQLILATLVRDNALVDGRLTDVKDELFGWDGLALSGASDPSAGLNLAELLAGEGNAEFVRRLVRLE